MGARGSTGSSAATLGVQALGHRRDVPSDLVELDDAQRLVRPVVSSSVLNRSADGRFRRSSDLWSSDQQPQDV